MPEPFPPFPRAGEWAAALHDDADHDDIAADGWASRPLPGATPFAPPPMTAQPRLGGAAARIPAATVALSTASTYPESTAAAFEMAARLGYDGVEVMVWTDPVSQSADALRQLVDYYGVPIVAVHAPCLLLTQRVWGTDPWAKLRRARSAAEKLGAATVVVHPPFRWQRDYARDFITGLDRMAEETDVRFAVENMFPLRARGRLISAYAPDWSPLDDDYPQVTLDLSHTSVSRSDALAMADELGERLVHVHLADGTGLAKDEHLVPGRGNQPCAELLEGLAGHGFSGTVVVEINTRRAESRAQREFDLAEALAFARLNLASAPLTATA
jgi:sugar phosphate isomerase/epimerase